MSIQQEAKPVLEKLLSADDATLLEQLGMSSKALDSRSPALMRLDATFTHDVTVMGPLDDLREIGRRLLARWSRELFKVMCGNAQVDAKDRESLLKAIGLGDVAVAGAITAFLISIAVTPAVAALVAALIVKRVITPGAETMCQYWAEQLKDK